MPREKYIKDIIVCGDIHAYWGPLNQLINQRCPSLILQVGDFGWWPRFHNTTNVNMYGKRKYWNQYGIKNPNTEILWCPGNHEDWDELSLRNATYSVVMPRVYYMPRGSIHILDDGRVILFVGGAWSIDMEARTPHIDWFPEEIIPISLIYKLKENGLNHVDIVISHTCPNEFNAQVLSKKPYPGWENKFYDPSQDVLSQILYEYKPNLWYFGHFHVSTQGYHDETNTKWFALADIPTPGWWQYLLNKDF
jgi:hypothetical protein